MRPSKPIAASSGRPWRRPISKSFGSWPGVTLSAPVPKSILTYSSAMIGTSRSTSGTIAVRPTRCAVALVVGMDGDGGVGQDRLGPHGRDRQEVVGAGDPVAHLVERVDRVLVAHLEVGDRRGARRAPVDHAVVAVDVALAVELHEHREHRVDVALVHREPLVAVVERAPEPLELLDDGGPGLVPPLPYPLEEPLAAEIPAGEPLGAKLLLDHGVDGDRRMVGAADPERVATLHPPQPDQGVLVAPVQGVAHVQVAGDVRQRKRDHVRLAAGVGHTAEHAGGLPPLEDRPLCAGGVVAGVHGPPS